MDVYKDPHGAANLIGKRLKHRFWQDRAFDMVQHCCTSPSPDRSTPIAMHNVRVDRVASDWPRIGSIIVTRDDGKRFKLHMAKGAFKVEEI